MLEAIKEKLEGEIERLMKELTVTLPLAIRKAVELGDLSENAEYKSALERQQFVQARLNHLTQRASEISRIDTSKISPDHVGFGSKVKLRDEQNGQEVSYNLLFGDFIDLDSDQISMASCCTTDHLGKKLGDAVILTLPLGDCKYTIVESVTLLEMLGR